MGHSGSMCLTDTIFLQMHVTFCEYSVEAERGVGSYQCGLGVQQLTSVDLAAWTKVSPLIMSAYHSWHSANSHV